MKIVKSKCLMGIALAFALIANPVFADPNGGRDMGYEKSENSGPGKGNYGRDDGKPGGGAVGAPEVDASTAPLMATLLIGGIAVLADRRRQIAGSWLTFLVIAAQE